MATRDHRQTFIASSRVPSKDTPPVSPRGARMRSAISSRRRGPSVPLAQLTKNLMGGAGRVYARSMGRETGGGVGARGGPGASAQQRLVIATRSLLPGGDFFVEAGHLFGGRVAIDLFGVHRLIDQHQDLVAGARAS